MIRAASFVQVIRRHDEPALACELFRLVAEGLELVGELFRRVSTGLIYSEQGQGGWRLGRARAVMEQMDDRDEV